MTDTILPSVYQEFIALSRYARYRPDLGRREKWDETVSRLMDFWRERAPQVETRVLSKIERAIKNLEVMPSMRSLMTAGEALKRDEVAGYNCSAVAIEGAGPKLELWNDKMNEYGYDEPIQLKLRSPIVFDEIFYILLCGTGAGFSVERQFVSELPTVGKVLSRSVYKRNNKNFPGVSKDDLSHIDRRKNVITVADTKYGWASALRILIVELYNGNFDVKWDVSNIRPAGAVLKTFGGRASGSSALVTMFERVVEVFRGANGRKLTSIEAHDVVCHVAESVVVGGVRRSALISLSNLSDDRMRTAKTGTWWNENPQRAMANNSVAYTEKPSIGRFMEEWTALYESKSGERGILNRVAARKSCEASGRDPNYEWITNPCSEISMRHTGQMCNLTSVPVRSDDKLDDLKRKVTYAAILGTCQATLTNFVYLSRRWKDNCEDERLLGISMSGMMDHPVLQNVSDEAAQWLEELAAVAREVNKKYAKILKINSAAAITCVKPEGTVSQLTDTASGLHPRYSPYYIRRVRSDAKDPLAKVMREQGYPCEVDVMQPSNLVFSFPIEAPKDAVFRDDRTAVEQLEYWRMIKRHWCDSHNPSITVYVREEEWLEAAAWVYSNFDEICGVSFLPHSDHTYQQAPYEECTREQYEKMLDTMPTGIDYKALMAEESDDYTTGTQEYACVAGQCELV